MTQTQTQMKMAGSRSWPRTWTAFLNKMRGTSKMARKRRGAIALGGMGLLVMSGLLLGVTSLREDLTEAGDLRAVAAGSAAVGVVVLGIVEAARPISKVTWRAWLAGWWYSRGLRRHAANVGGHPSARARRSVRNKAAWAAQRQRDGRAARPEYGSPVRQRIVFPRHTGDAAP